MARKHVEILSDKSDSCSDDSEYNIESDDNDVANEVFEGLNEAELDKILYKMNKRVCLVKFLFILFFAMLLCYI
uniref:Uncharacterized protein n=1 Tax=Oryza meridionalis TaxID=40149 RepID=A0A0E0FEV5_9ORYZ